MPMRHRISSLHLRRTLCLVLSLLPWVAAYALGTFVSSFTKRPPTPLMDAVRQNQVEAVRTLLAQGADADEKAAYGSTALWMAADTGNLALAKLLIEAGANVNQRLDNGEPLLMHAVGQGSRSGRSPELVELLLAHGADVNARSDGGSTALHVAALRDETGDMVRVLLKAGADAAAANCAGTTVLGQAVHGASNEPPRGNLEVIRQLLAAGAHPHPYTAARIHTLAAGKDARVLRLLAQATPIIPTPYPCPGAGPSEEVRALKAWGDRHHLALSYGGWARIADFGVLVFFTVWLPPGLLLLCALLSKDRVSSWQDILSFASGMPVLNFEISAHLVFPELFR